MIPRRLILALCLISIAVMGAYAKGRVDNEANHTAAALAQAQADAKATADLAAADGERGMLASDLLPFIRRLVNPDSITS